MYTIDFEVKRAIFPHVLLKKMKNTMDFYQIFIIKR